jgi:hypothetical protein
MLMSTGRWNRVLISFAVVAVASTAMVLGDNARATAPPVGPLPPGQVTQVRTVVGSLVSVVLPQATRKDFVWRLARQVNPSVAVEVSEGAVGRNVVVVFKTKGPGRTAIAFGLTRGEAPKAIRSVTYRLTVAP